MTLDEGYTRLRSAIARTWDEISGDAYETCEGDNEIAMELVLDANRMAFAGFEAEDRMVRDLCAEHGWTTVREYFARRIQLL
jgi:hypothetical protein